MQDRHKAVVEAVLSSLAGGPGRARGQSVGAERGRSAGPGPDLFRSPGRMVGNVPLKERTSEWSREQL